MTKLKIINFYRKQNNPLNPKKILKIINNFPINRGKSYNKFYKMIKWMSLQKMIFEKC